jgi:rare lipoprotein A
MPRRPNLARIARCLMTGLALVLAGCSTVRDGPGSNPPPNLERVPDAEPRIEPIRIGGANKAYEVQGRSYVPLKEDKPFSEKGLASWYGRKFNGKRTASGEPYDMYAMTAAHRTLPIPSYARVRNPANGREVIVRVNDRGPFVAGRVIDLSYTAALRLGLLGGLAPVEVSRITFEEIRTGAWRKTPLPGEPSIDVAVASASASRSTEDGAVPQPMVKPAAALMPAVEASAAEATPMAEAASAAPTRGFWVQLGAFRQREGAETFHRRVAADLDWLAPSLAVAGDAGVFRLQAGPYAGREEAQAVSQRVRESLRLVPVIVEKR